MAGDENPRLEQTQCIRNGGATPMQSSMAFREIFGKTWDKASVKLQDPTERAIPPSRGVLEMGAEKFVEFLRHLDPDRYFPLPLNLT